MKKTLATIGVVTATAFAGMGIATVASAQVDEDSTTDSTDSTDSSVESTEDGTDAERDGERDGNRSRKGCGDKLEGVAETLGMDAEALQAELDAGSTLAEIAEANGVDPDVLVDQMVADATERIEGKVEDGRITEDEAADKLASKTEKISERVFGEESSADLEAS